MSEDEESRSENQFVTRVLQFHPACHLNNHAKSREREVALHNRPISRSCATQDRSAAPNLRKTATPTAGRAVQPKDEIAQHLSFLPPKKIPVAQRGCFELWKRSSVMNAKGKKRTRRVPAPWKVLRRCVMFFTTICVIPVVLVLLVATDQYLRPTGRNKIVIHSEVSIFKFLHK